MAPVLLDNNRRIGFKWKQNLMLSRRYGHGAENPKDTWRFKYRISINYISFGKFSCIYLKNWEFLQNFKNRTRDKLNLPKRECPAGIVRVGMSAYLIFFIEHTLNIEGHNSQWFCFWLRYYFPWVSTRWYCPIRDWVLFFRHATLCKFSLHFRIFDITVKYW